MEVYYYENLARLVAGGRKQTTLEDNEDPLTELQVGPTENTKGHKIIFESKLMFTNRTIIWKISYYYNFKELYDITLDF